MYDDTFGKSLGPRFLELQESEDLNDADKTKHVTGLRNHALFGNNGNIKKSMVSVSARVDISADKKLDLTAKVSRPNSQHWEQLWSLYLRRLQEICELLPEKLANLKSKKRQRPVNPLLDAVDAVWKGVITEAPEISWIDETSDQDWWLKKWTLDDPCKPPKCIQSLCQVKRT